MPGHPGVLLDIDGTLLDTTYLHGIAWQRAFRSRGHDVTAATVHRAIGLGDDQLVPHVLGDVGDDVASDVAGAHGEEYAALQAEEIGRAHV